MADHRTATPHRGLLQEINRSKRLVVEERGNSGSQDLDKPVTCTPLVSIIILNWNGFDDTVRCLDSLRYLDYPSFEVILVDNGSSDGSRDRLPRAIEDLPYPVELIQSSHNAGFAGGNALALQRCRGEFIALLNNDTAVDPTWLSRLVEGMVDQPAVAAVGGKSYFWDDQHPAYDRSNPFYCYQDIDPYLACVYTRIGCESPRYVDNLLGCAVLLRISAITESGFLDEHFFAYYEETDLFARFLRAGKLLAYEPSAMIWHKVAASSGVTSSFRSFYLQRNRAFFAIRNFDRPYIRFFLCRYMRDEMLFLARYWRHRLKHRPGDENDKARIRAFCDVIINAPRLLAERRAIVRNGRYNDQLELVRDTSVSVIISSCVASHHLAETIESISLQSHRVDEIVVVDDGFGVDSRLPVYCHDVAVTMHRSQGPSRAENEGFGESHGRYVLFLDAGDRLRPDAIRSYLRAISSDPRASFAYGDADVLHTGQRTVRSRSFRARALLKGNYIHGSALIKREAFESVGGYPRLTSRVLEDWDLYLSLAEHGHKGVYIPQVLVECRRDETRGHGMAEPSEAKEAREQMSHRHPRLDPMGRLVLVRAWRRWTPNTR